MDSLQVVNPNLHELVKKGVPLTSQPNLRGFIKGVVYVNDLAALGDDGKALAPLLQAEILCFVIIKNWPRTSEIPNTILLDRIEDSLRGLMIVAPDEPNTLNAILELLRYYLSWCKEGYAGSPRPLIYFIEQLGTLGPKAKEGLPVLRELTLVKNKSVKKAAQQALEQVTKN
jgi:hypothetical protein